jgi:hypothetical protein
MLPMGQLFFRQQYKCHHDHSTSRICRERWIKAEEQPVCYGHEEDAQSIDSQREIET